MNLTRPNSKSAQTWHGGHYGIEFEFHVLSDAQLGRILSTLWSHPSLEGCYLSRDQELNTQVRVNAEQHVDESHLYGIAKLPNGRSAVCGTYVCRLRNEDDLPLRDLLAFYVPLGSLVEAYLVGGYPFSGVDRAYEWRGQLDGWLVELGRTLYRQAVYDLALVGWEVDFPKVSAAFVQEHGIPAERFDGYLWRIGEQLEWYPPTNLEIVRFPSKQVTPKARL